jgi:hypothetical protein
MLLSPQLERHYHYYYHHYYHHHHHHHHHLQDPWADVMLASF